MKYPNIERLRQHFGGQSVELIAEYIGAWVVGDITLNQVSRWTGIDPVIIRDSAVGYAP